ncbi:unnamed protein product [Eruca vesicaria subsp. sativa]|uniref:Uncharacterized protein n=1 Tax=Eruca vesicaria subsp. sativa TaxID=29727 RepID=A0ABC8M5T6_ERUVS|nr:unnamed protein product [Eruca vesicaria subsp. sativa]
MSHRRLSSAEKGKGLDLVSQQPARNARDQNARGIPPLSRHDEFPQEVLDGALSKARDAMIQYTLSADPSERQVRQERMRQAEERGQLENTALLIARADSTRDLVDKEYLQVTPPRPLMSQRLGPIAPIQEANSGEILAATTSSSRDRLHPSLRLGPQPLSPPRSPEDKGASHSDRVERIPAVMRLGPSSDPPMKELDTETTTAKRKPGRPPGSGKGSIKKGTQAVVPPRRRTASNRPSPRRKGAIHAATTSKAASSKAAKMKNARGPIVGTVMMASSRPIGSKKAKIKRKTSKGEIY